MNGLLSHKNAIELLVSDKLPELFICTETHLTNEILQAEASILGYNCIRSDSNSRHSAGIEYM